MAINPTAEVRVSTTVDRPSLRRTEKQITQALNKVETMASRGGLLSKSYTQPLGKITGAVGEFEKSLEASNARVIAFGASAAIIYNVGRALEFTARAAIDLEHKLAEVNVILNASTAGLKQFSAELFDIAKITGQTFDGVSQAALEFARQGLNMQETLQRTRDAMILVRLAGLDVQSSVESITATINSFNQSIISSTTLVNKLANVDAAFAVSSADLAKAISRVGSSAQDAGVSLDELIAMTTTAQQVTARGGAVIGNSLKTIFTRIQRPAVIANLEAFGMAVTDSSGAMLPAIQVLRNFASAYDTLSPQQRAVTAEMVGGVFQVNVLKAAIGDLGKNFSIYDRALSTSVSSTDEAIQRNNMLNKTLKTLMNETMVNLLEVGAKIGSITLSPAITNVLESVNSALDKMRDNADSDSIGVKMGKGILDGIGSILKGPGMMVLGALVGKLLFSFMKFSTDAVKTFAGMNEGARRQAEMQMLIQNILLKNPGLIDAAATSEQNLARVSEKILEVIRQRNFALAQSEKLSSNIARNIGAADMKAMNVMMSGGDTGMTEGAWRPVNMARGFVPNLSKRKERQAREVAGAVAGGYKPGRIKEMTVPSFGRVTYNDAETVKKFPDFKQPAIMPPEKSEAGSAYKKKFQGKHGFDPYNAAAGFIPNFSKITDLAAVKYLGGKENWKKASQQEKDQAVAKYLKESTSKLSDEATSISAWRTGEGISQGAPTNWVNHYEDGRGALTFDPEKFPQSYEAAKPFVSILKKHQEDNTLKNVKEGNVFEDQLMEYFGIGVGTKGARNISFDFVGPSTIPSDPKSQELKKQIKMDPSTDVGDAHVGAGHDKGLWMAKFLRYNAETSVGAVLAKNIAEAFYPSDPKTGKWDPKKKGLNTMDVAKQTGDGTVYTDVLGRGTDKDVKESTTVWSVARDNWAGLKAELLQRVNESQIKHDAKQFQLSWRHDAIDKSALEKGFAAFGGVVPNFATKILDRDQLAQYLGGAGVDAAFQSIVKQATQRGQLAETIVGTAGAGKTTLAIQKAGGKNFVTSAKDLSPDDQLIVVRAAKTVVDSPEFTQAGKITYLKGAKDVINQMRDQRSKQIREGTSETGFGRDPSMKFGSTSGVLTEALLAESYAGKLSVYERQADMSLKKAKEFEKLHELKGATATIGAFAPFTSGHQSMSEQADVDVAFVSKGANRQYDVGLSAKEKAKLIEMANPNIMAVPGSAGIQEHFEHGGKAYRMKKADTKVALGADRVAGGEEDLTKSFSAFKGVTAVEGRLDGVSGTKIRKAIVDGNTGILDSNLPPQVSSVIKKNLPVLQKRAAFIQDRKDKAAAAMTKLTSEEDAFKAKYGKAKRKGELAEITQARAEFREKKKILKKRMSGYGGRAWDRLGLQMNFASQGFVPSFAYKGMHQKDFGTTMVGRKGAMGTNLSDEQVQKMTAGMRMIRGPEGETLVVGTDMKGRSGRMIATGLTARKIKKSGPHWRTMLNEVPHLFDGLAYDLVGGVAGADWDPEGTSGAMGGIKFEDEFAAAHGLPKAGAKKGSDFTVAETIAKKLGTQKNIQAKVSLHERSKRDKAKVVDIASGFSKYLVDILSHNIKTYGLSSVTTPDRFQQAMEVLNQNPATKKDWVKYFGPMGTKSMGLIPNFFGPKGNKKKNWKGTSQRTKKHSPTGSTFFMTPGKSKGRGKKKTGVRKPGIRKGKKGLHKASGMIPNFAYEATRSESESNFAEDFTPNFAAVKGGKAFSASKVLLRGKDPIYDGDSLRVNFFATRKPVAMTTRLFGADANELRDKPKGPKAKELLREHIIQKFGSATDGTDVTEVFKAAGTDNKEKFGRAFFRDDVFVKKLIENKLGVEYYGQGEKATKEEEKAKKTAKTFQKKRNRAAEGLVPNLAQDALKEAIGREMAAGYDKKQVKVGYDSRLKQSDGVGVYNSTEGSLTNAINMHLSSGKTITDLQTQGAHRGHIPNFVDGMDAGIGLMSMGLLASSMGGLKDAVGALKGGFEASEEAIKAFDAAIAEAETKQSEAATYFAEAQAEATAALQNEQRARDELAAGESKRDELKGRVSELGGKRERAEEMMASFGRKQRESVAQANVIRDQMTAVESKDFSTEAREGLALQGGYMSGMEMVGAAAAGDEKAKELLAQQDQKQKELKAAELEELEKQLKAQKEKTAALSAQRDRANELESRFREQEQQAEENLEAQRQKNKALGDEFVSNKKKAKTAQADADEAADILKDSKKDTKEAKDAKNKTRKGFGSRVASFVDKGGASAIMMGAPLVGGMLKQGMDEENLQGRAAVEGVMTGASTVATTAQMGAAAGAPGIAIAGTIGLAMAARDFSNNLKKAKIKEKFNEVSKEAESLGEKLNAVTAGGQAYMESLEKVETILSDTTGNVKPEELAKARSAMVKALGDVPSEFQAKFRAAAGDAEKIKEVFGEITEELAKAKADLDAAAAGYGLQEKFASGEFGFFSGTDNQLFETKSGGGLTTEAKRIEAEFKQAMRGGLDMDALRDAAEQGLSVDFSDISKVKEFSDENFAIMIESLEGSVKQSDLKRIGRLVQDYYQNMLDGNVTTKQAIRDLQRKNHIDKIQADQLKILQREARNFNLVIGKVVDGIKSRAFVLQDMTSSVKEFAVDFQKINMQGARTLSDPFMTKTRALQVDLATKEFDIRATSLREFRKAVSDGSKANLESILQEFSKNSEKVASMSASLTTKQNKENLGELARNRKAQEAMLPIIEKAFEAWSTDPTNLQALDGVIEDMSDVLEDNGIAREKASDAAAVLLQSVKNNGKDTVNKLAQQIQKMNQQIAVERQQVYWAQRSAKLQERLASFGGPADFFGGAGEGGMSQSFKGLTDNLEAQIKGAISNSVTDLGRANAQLLDQLLNKMGLADLRKNFEGLAPLLSSAIAGRAKEIGRQIGFAQRLTSIADPDLELPSVNAEQIATDQIAAQLKLNQLPDDVAAIRENTAIMARLIQGQTKDIVDSNTSSFDKALKLNGIPQNLKNTVLGIGTSGSNTVNAVSNLGLDVNASGQVTAAEVDDVKRVNAKGFGVLMGASLDFQKAVSNLPADYQKTMSPVMAQVVIGVRQALQDELGNFKTNIASEMADLTGPMGDYQRTLDNLAMLPEGQEKIDAVKAAEDALAQAQARQQEFDKLQNRFNKGQRNVDQAKLFGLDLENIREAGRDQVASGKRGRGFKEFLGDNQQGMYSLQAILQNAAIAAANTTQYQAEFTGSGGTYSEVPGTRKDFRNDREQIASSLRAVLVGSVTGRDQNLVDMGIESGRGYGLKESQADRIIAEWTEAVTNWDNMRLTTGELDDMFSEMGALDFNLEDAVKQSSDAFTATKEPIDNFRSSLEKARDDLNNWLNEAPQFAVETKTVDDGQGGTMQIQSMKLLSKEDAESKAKEMKTRVGTATALQTTAGGAGTDMQKAYLAWLKTSKEGMDFVNKAGGTAPDFADLARQIPENLRLAEFKEKAAPRLLAKEENVGQDLAEKEMRRQNLQESKSGLLQERLNLSEFAGFIKGDDKLTGEIHDIFKDDKRVQEGVAKFKENEKALRENREEIAKLDAEIAPLRASFEELTELAHKLRAAGIELTRPESVETAEPVSAGQIQRDKAITEAKAEAQRDDAKSPEEQIKQTFRDIWENPKDEAGNNYTRPQWAQDFIDTFDKKADESDDDFKARIAKAFEEALKRSEKQDQGPDTRKRKPTDQAGPTAQNVGDFVPAGYKPQANRKFLPEAFGTATENFRGKALADIDTELNKIADVLKDIETQRENVKPVQSFQEFVQSQGLEPLGEEEQRAAYEQAPKDPKALEALDNAENIAYSRGEALKILRKSAEIESKRTAMLQELNLKNISINQEIFDQVGLTDKLQKLLELYGDMQKEVMQDNLVKAIAETRKMAFATGGSGAVIGSNNFQDALMNQVGETTLKSRISGNRSRVLEDIKMRRRNNLMGADLSGILSSGAEARRPQYNVRGDLRMTEEGARGAEALKKYGLSEDMGNKELREWAVNNQAQLLNIINDPALQIDTQTINMIRDLFVVMKEEEALRLSIKDAVSSSNAEYEYNLELYQKGLITFDQLSQSFAKMEGAAASAREFVDGDKLRSQMRATAMSVSDTFAQTLHKAMNNAARGSEIETSINNLINEYVTNPQSQISEADRARMLNERNTRDYERGNNRGLTFAEQEQFESDNRELIERRDSAKDNSKRKKKLSDQIENKRSKFVEERKEAEQARQDSEDKKMTGPKDQKVLQAAKKAADSFRGSLTRANEAFDAGTGSLQLVQGQFEGFERSIRRLIDTGQIDEDTGFERINKARLELLKRTGQQYSSDLALVTSGLQHGSIAAADGAAKIQTAITHYQNFGKAAGVSASSITDANVSLAQKYNEEFNNTKELFKEGAISTADLATSLDAANEAAIRAGNYGFKEFSNSLRMGFTYTTQDFAKDIDSMGREFGQDFKSGVSGAFSEAIKGTKNLKEAFGDAFAAMADKMLDKSLDIGVSALMSPLGFNKGGIVKGYSSGGSVTGGSGTKDDVPAYLTKGEYVIKKSSVQAYGKDFFDSLNKGSVVQANKGGAISRLVKQQTEKQRELDAAGIRQFSYKWADPEKTKEDWLGRDTGQAVMNTSSDFRVNMGTTLTPERIDAIQAVAEKYPDVAKNLDRDLFDQSKLEIGQGNYKVRLNNRFVYDNMKRPDQGMMRTDTRLSAAALTDENNPQNQYKFEKREAFFDYQRERLDYIKEQQEAYEKFEREKEGRRWGFLFGGAALGLGGMLAGGGRRGTYMNFATGGMSPDNVAALLTGGEYVIRKDVVDKHGTQFFDKLNKGELPKFNVGGLVGAPTSRQNGRNDSSPAQRDITSDRTGGATSNTNNISITVNVDSNGNVGAETQENQGEAGNLTEEESKELAGKIKSSVLNVIIEQKRPGGMLYGD